MDDGVRITCAVCLAIVLVFSGIFSMAWSIHEGNVQVATECVKTGGEWKIDKNNSNEHSCVRG